jgi:CBS domain-containing protein
VIFRSNFIPDAGGDMLKVKDIMTREVKTVSPETEITQAAKLLLSERINGVPVINQAGELVGILCQSDLIAQQKGIPIPSLFTLLDGYIPLTRFNRLDKEVEKIAATTVEHAMTSDPVTVASNTDIEKVAALMVEKNYHTLPVVDNGKLVGVVGKEDVLRTLLTSAER